MRISPLLRLGVTSAAALLLPLSGWAQEAPAMNVNAAAHHDVSPPLRDMPQGSREYPARDKPLRLLQRGLAQHQHDPVVQSSAGATVATTNGINIAGVGNGDYGFVPNAAPPDTNGAVGATQYVQWVNESFAVFDKKTGAKLLGPVAGNTLWSGFGGGCQTNNDGDPIVQYDKAANRWVMTQFSVSTTPYLQCVAVSKTSDATGQWFRYSFQQPNFNDYPKLGVWPDGYYISYNMFSGNTFAGGRACAMDRTAMLAGAPATQICFQLSTAYGGLLPADLDGSTPPPAGAPNPYVAFGNNSASLDLWRFHADFATPGNSSFTHINIPAPAFSAACSGGGTCIPQSGTTQQLDSLADRLMYRLAYRNFGDHEALVVNHSVTVGTSVGVRWYEIRDPNGAPTVFQSGTFAPDAKFRWMGSIAMDKVGNIALGYSVSSASTFPSIAFTGRASTDPAGTLQAESLIVTGGGSQNNRLSRWGDYSAMTIDPTDDCTFFYTTEYLKSSGSFNWSTRIASFSFPSCSGSSSPVLTTITVAPSTASVPINATQQFSAAGKDQFGNPVSPQPSFSWSASPGGTIDQTGLFTAGAVAGATSTITAASGNVSGTASATITSGAPAADFSLSVSPATQSVKRSGSVNYVVTVTPVNGFNTGVTLTVSGQPAGSTAAFSSNPATSTSTLSIGSLPPSSTNKSYQLVVKGVSGSLTHSATATLQVTK